MRDLGHIWTDETVAVADMLGGVGAETRMVGGPVRDALLGLRPKDLDLCTDATPTAMLEAADAAGVKSFPTLAEVRKNPVLWTQGGLKHGTVSFVVNKQVIEVTTLRRDVETDGRHATVEFVSDFRQDAARRDFTFNAMSVDRAGRLHDHFGGERDLGLGIVRFVGRADDRIQEDYLRILRYFRFHGRYSSSTADKHPDVMEVHEASLSAVNRNAAGLRNVSGQRMWQEMSKILTDAGTVSVLRDMSRSGAANAIGLEMSNQQIQAAGTASRSGAPAPVVLGLLVPQDGEDLARQWRMASEEIALVKFTAARARMSTAGFADFLDFAMDPKVKRAHVSSLLVGFGRSAEAARIAGPLPEFPVRGADLVDLGMETGPAMGETLAGMRRTWRMSGYSASAEDLLATVPRARLPGR